MRKDNNSSNDQAYKQCKGMGNNASNDQAGNKGEPDITASCQNLSVPGVLSNGVLLSLFDSLQGLGMASSSAKEVAGLQLTSQAPHHVAPHDIPLPPYVPQGVLHVSLLPPGIYTSLPLLLAGPKVLFPLPHEFTPCFREFENGFCEFEICYV